MRFSGRGRSCVSLVFASRFAARVYSDRFSDFRMRRFCLSLSTTFVHNHAQAIVACDFLVSVTATFRVLYVFVAMEIGSRRILHVNVTGHPTAEWTVQQVREFLAYDHPYRFVIHDRDTIFSAAVDSALKDFGVRALKTPVRTPTANAFCERVIGTIRRECLDFIIPMNQQHPSLDSPRVRQVLQSWPTPLILRARNSRADSGERSGHGPKTQTASRLSNHFKIDSRRFAPRLSPGKGGRLASDRFFAEHAGSCPPVRAHRDSAPFFAS